MKQAALYVCGKIVMADSHLMAFQRLSIQEKQAAEIISGFFNVETEEFESDIPQDHFYDKQMILIRHPDTERDGQNPSLSSKGVDKTYEIVESLKDKDLSDYRGITSPMTRCLETADILQKKLDLPFEVNPDVVESPMTHDQKEFQIENLQSKYPNFYWPNNKTFFIKKENEIEFRKRTRNVLQNFPHRCIVITHFGVIFHISQDALCEHKANVLFSTGIPRGSVTFINRDTMQMIGTDNENIF